MSEDGTQFVSCDSEGVLMLCDLRNCKPVAQLTNKMAYGHGSNCVRYLRGEKYLAAGNTDGSLTIVDLITNEVMCRNFYLRVLTEYKRYKSFHQKHLDLTIV